MRHQDSCERETRCVIESQNRPWTSEFGGLSLKSLSGKSKKKGGHPLYKGRRVYQHPDDKALVWKANGLRELEAKGGRAVEVETASENASPEAMKKAVSPPHKTG